MKKILLALLLIFAILLSACGVVKYEYKDGVMYGDGKEATGTFEFKAGKYKVKGNFVNGVPDGLFEEYYPDGNIMNPLMITNDKESAIYNENKEMLFKVENAKAVDIGTTLKKLEDGSFELVKSNKVVAKIDANGELIKYLYSTGETMLKVNEATGVTEFFFKNGNTFMKEDGNKNVLNYKDGKPLYEMDGDSWKIYNEEGEKIAEDFELVTNIKKVD